MDRKAKKHANRRARLQQLILERVGGDNMAEFGRRYGYTRSQIAQYLSPSYNGGYSMGEGVVEKLEVACDLPDGWFDWPANGSMDWPFNIIDERKVRALDSSARDKLEKSVLDSAAQLGLDVKKENI